MDYNYTLVGPSFSRGRLFRILGQKKDDSFPIRRLDVHIPAIELFKVEQNEFEELETSSRLSLSTGFAICSSPDIGYISFSVKVFGFGFSIIVQKSY